VAQEAALDLLLALVRGRRRLGERLLARPEASLPALMRFVRDERPAARLLACACIAALAETGACAPAACWHELLAVLHATVRLLAAPSRAALEHAPEVIGALLRCHPTLHRLVGEAGAVAPLVAQAGAAGASARQQELSLRALALISAESDGLRAVVAAAGAVPLARDALRAPAAGVRVAACHCLRSLSRSVHLLRTVIADAQLAAPLCALLRDPHAAGAAAAALCNLLLAFSPARDDALAAGVIAPLAAAATSAAAPADGPAARELRVSAAWALRNLSFRADLDTKRRILGALGARCWDALHRLDAHDPELVLHFVALLRNLLHRERPPAAAARRTHAAAGAGSVDYAGGADSASGTGVSGAAAGAAAGGARGVDVALVLEQVGEEMLLSRLEACVERAPGAEALHEALLAVSNIAAGAPAHRQAVLARPALVLGVARQLGAPEGNSASRLAAMWCLWNLAGRRRERPPRRALSEAPHLRWRHRGMLPDDRVAPAGAGPAAAGTHSRVGEPARVRARVSSLASALAAEGAQEGAREPRDAYSTSLRRRRRTAVEEPLEPFTPAPAPVWVSRGRDLAPAQLAAGAAASAAAEEGAAAATPAAVAAEVQAAEAAESTEAVEADGGGWEVVRASSPDGSEGGESVGPPHEARLLRESSLPDVPAAAARGRKGAGGVEEGEEGGAEWSAEEAQVDEAARLLFVRLGLQGAVERALLALDTDSSVAARARAIVSFVRGEGRDVSA